MTRSWRLAGFDGTTQARIAFLPSPPGAPRPEAEQPPLLAASHTAGQMPTDAYEHPDQLFAELVR
jgi:hypothetical protein